MVKDKKETRKVLAVSYYWYMVVPWKFSKCHEEVLPSYEKKRRNVRVGFYTKGNSNKILISSPNTTKFKDLAWRGNCRTFLFVQRDPMETHSNEGSTVSWLMSWRSKRKRKEYQIIFFPPWWCIIEYWVGVCGRNMSYAIVRRNWDPVTRDLCQTESYPWSLVCFPRSHSLVWYRSMYDNVSVESVLCRLPIRSILHFTSSLRD